MVHGGSKATARGWARVLLSGGELRPMEAYTKIFANTPTVANLERALSTFEVLADNQGRNIYSSLPGRQRDLIRQHLERVRSKIDMSNPTARRQFQEGSARAGIGARMFQELVGE